MSNDFPHKWNSLDVMSWRREAHKVNGTVSRVNIAWERIKVLNIFGVTIKRSSENSKVQVMQGILLSEKEKSWKILDGFSIGIASYFKYNRTQLFISLPSE